MSDDSDSPHEREMKDFQFRQMKKTRVFEPAAALPKERSSLLTVSNKFGLTFVGQDRIFKVYLTELILAADKVDCNPNEIIEGAAALAEVTVELCLHHLALSSDELTLSVCGVSEEAGLSLTFYDVRTFINKARPEKLPFASWQPTVPLGTLVQDLKWNPVQASMLAACLSDGSMMILDVTYCVNVQASLPASSGITCICWSPKGKQVAAGKMNSTVSQYTPALEEKKVIPCPHFYTSDNPVKVLDVLWLKTFVFAVVYAAADGSLESPPQLVLISLPKKDEKMETKYLNFCDTVYGSCTERQHHYFLSHIEDWDLFFAASAASIEVSVIARQDDKLWELWILEDASRAELPVSDTVDDTLPLGLAIDYTSRQEIRISDEKILPPAPTMLMLSTEGVLCPFALLNHNPGVKQLITPPTTLTLEGERLPKPGSLVIQPPKSGASIPSMPAVFPNLGLTSAAPAAPPAPAASSAAASFSIAPRAPVSSSGFTFSLPSTCAPSAATSLPFSVTTTFGSGSSGFSFASKPPSDAPSGPSAFSFSTPSIKPSTVPAPTPAPTPQSIATASVSTVKLNLNNRFSAVETPGPTSQAFSVSSSLPKAVVSSASSLPTPTFTATKPAATLTPVHPLQTSTPTTVVQKPSAAPPVRVQTPQAAIGVKAVEKQLQQKKESDPIMTGILEEISHFQKELDDLKVRSSRADFKVGTNEEMKGLRKESEDLHVFTLEIKETTESLHGDIGTLKTTLLEGFAGAEEAKAQRELSRDRNYRQLLYKKPLDPRSEEQLKEIRRLYQYVTFAVEDVNDVLDVDWQKHLEKKKKQKHMVVPGREGLFTTLANNLYIINQQKNRLDQLVKELASLRLYNKTAMPAINPNTVSATEAGLEDELESLRDALLKARLDATPPKTKSTSPAVKISPLKQSELRNFLSKRQMPPVRSTAPANLSRSAFLSPKYYEDLDDVSSTSSLSQSMEPHLPHLELEEEELQQEPPSLALLPPSLSIPRHPTVVRTPSIQPGFGTIQSTPLTKIQSVQGITFGLSPIASPVPTNKINLSSADSTALATKTVKHGAPPAERTTPVTISAQQAAATAAVRRQMANQKNAVVSTSLTESTLKTVPQVVNVQELKDRGTPLLTSSIISSSVSDPPAANQQVVASVSSTQAKRNPSPGIQKISTESTPNSQAGFMFGQLSKTDISVAPASSAEQSTNKGFSFSSAPSGFSFTSITLGAGMPQGNGKVVFGQAGEENFSLTPKSASPALVSGSPTLPPSTSGEAAKPTPTPAALKIQPQPPKTAGGETLGIFSEIRVGQGEDAKDSTTKPTAAPFLLVESGASKGPAQFSFGADLKSAEDSAGADLSKGTVASSLFKPPETNSKLAFSVPSAAGLHMSFCSLLAAPSDSSDESKIPPQASEPTPPPEKELNTDPPVESPDDLGASEPAISVASTEPVYTVKAQTPPLATTSPVPEPPSSVSTSAEPTSSAPVSDAPTTEAISDTFPPAATTTTTISVPDSTLSDTAAVAIDSQVAPAAPQGSSSDKPGSIFTQPAPVTTESSTLAVTPVINTVAPVATTPTLTTTETTTTSASSTVFGQPAAPQASSAPAATGFGSTGFSTSGTDFGKSIFGQGSGFGQSGSNTGTSGGFSFGQSTFGASSGSATTGGSLFGASTATNASSFSFGTSSANTASSPGTGLFGQNTTPVFGSSGFSQGSLFGSNTSTSSSAGFSFGQPSGFGCSSATPVFGQQPSTGSVFGQSQPSSGGSLFGSNSTNTAGSSTGGGLFSGLGGKPSEEAASKNPFGPTASTGGFGQSTQTGTNSLFGNSGAKAIGFGQSSFGEQKPSGTFSTGGGSVASQGFGSFSSPAKPGCFGSAPVFGSPPSFGVPPSFGSTATFGSSPSFSTPMGSSAGKVFGEGTAAANMGGFG
ncbi:nuclear pore complex protein Nup214 [Aulostomus maculatus]